MYFCFEFPCFAKCGDLTQHIIHTLVKATVLENVCHFRTRVSAIATHFLRTVFSTVHYMILLCQIPSKFTVAEGTQKLKFSLFYHYCAISQIHSVNDV